MHFLKHTIFIKCKTPKSLIWNIINPINLLSSIRDYFPLSLYLTNLFHFIAKVQAIFIKLSPILFIKISKHKSMLFLVIYFIPGSTSNVPSKADTIRYSRKESKDSTFEEQWRGQSGSNSGLSLECCCFHDWVQGRKETSKL